MNHKTIDANSIYEHLDGLLPPERLKEIAPLIELASEVVGKKNFQTVTLNLPESESRPLWNKEYLTAQAAVQCHEVLEKKGAILNIRCPLYIKLDKSGESFSQSYFDIYLRKDISDTSRRPRFIREGITIPEDRVPTVRGYTSIVVVEQGALATLLGDSENPAHTEWEKNATKFKGKYLWGATTIDFVRLSVTKALQLLSQGDEEEDYAVLSDIFYLDQQENEDEVPDERRKKRKNKPGIAPPSPLGQLPDPKPQSYRLSRCEDGFTIRGPNKPMSGVRAYEVAVAYDFAGASKASALKKYHKNDFDLCKGKNVCRPQISNVKGLQVGGNTIKFLAEKNDFEIVVKGFDSQRDIIVDVKSEVVSADEAF